MPAGRRHGRQRSPPNQCLSPVTPGWYRGRTVTERRAAKRQRRHGSPYKAPTKSAAGKAGPASSGRARQGVKDPTPSRQPQANQWREAVDGREHELLGIGLIAVGIILGLALFFKVA